MNLLIVGGGIGGLTLGLLLERAGIQFRVFEAVERLRILGLGIMLRPDAVQVLTDLGLGDQLTEFGVPLTEVAAITADGIVTETVACGRATGAAMPLLAMHRGRLHQLLVDALRSRVGSDRLVCGAALSDWIEDEAKIVANFRDRRLNQPTGSAQGDALIAADGINSVARERLYPVEGPVRPAGVNIWRGVGPGVPPRGGHSVLVIGTSERRITVAPVAPRSGGPPLLNWVAEIRMPLEGSWHKPQWTRRGEVDEVARRFGDFRFDWLDVPAMIRGTEEVYEHPLVGLEPLPRWSTGRVALLGDAAHPTFQLGSGGASDAIRDAYVMMRSLSGEADVGKALAAYQTQRREEMRNIGRGSQLGAGALTGGGEVNWAEPLDEPAAAEAPGTRADRQTEEVGVPAAPRAERGSR